MDINDILKETFKGNKLWNDYFIAVDNLKHARDKQLNRQTETRIEEIVEETDVSKLIQAGNMKIV